MLKVLIRLLKARLKVLLKVLVRLLKPRLEVLFKVLIRQGVLLTITSDIQKTMIGQRKPQKSKLT